jgi:hypothetical protein
MTLKSPLTSVIPRLTIGIRAIALILPALLAGCDTDNGSKSAMTSEALIEGFVSDIHGPLNAGQLEVKDKGGRTVLSQQFSGQGNHFSIRVPAGTSYPILLVFTTPSGSITPQVRAVVTSPLADRMDVTDITSLVVDAAMALGGLTEENIAKASGGAIGLRQRQGVSAGAGGGGAGAGQSGGGVSRGGHGGHDMSGGSSTAQPGNPSAPMQGMQH